MSEEEKNLVNKIERWINKEEEYCTNEDLKELLNILDKYVDLYNKEKEKNKKIEETVRKGMKNLWVDTCAEDSGKYSAYMSIRNILEE